MSGTKGTPFSLRFQLRLPLVVAPMAGGPTTPALVAAASNSGALGFLGAAYWEPAQIRREIDATRALTARPIGVNLFAPAPEPRVTEADWNEAKRATAVYRAELGLPAPEIRPPYHPDFDAQFAAVLEAKPDLFSFVFGPVAREHLRACAERGIYTVGTATTLEEARALEADGVDAVVAQGFEAGGHRGVFDGNAEDPGIGTFALVRTLARRLKIPVIAAGGIMDGAGIAAALRLGAEAAQLGTAFLLCEEAGTSAPYREALAAPRPVTRITRAFSGRPARGLENRFLREQRGQRPLPFPAQNAFTRDLRNASARQGRSDFLSLWAGAGVELLPKRMPVAALVDQLAAELAAAEGK